VTEILRHKNFVTEIMTDLFRHKKICDGNCEKEIKEIVVRRIRWGNLRVMDGRDGEGGGEMHRGIGLRGSGTVMGSFLVFLIFI